MVRETRLRTEGISLSVGVFSIMRTSKSAKPTVGREVIAVCERSLEI